MRIWLSAFATTSQLREGSQVCCFYFIKATRIARWMPQMHRFNPVASLFSHYLLTLYLQHWRLRSLRNRWLRSLFFERMYFIKLYKVWFETVFAFVNEAQIPRKCQHSTPSTTWWLGPGIRGAYFVGGGRMRPSPSVELIEIGFQLFLILFRSLAWYFRNQVQCLLIKILLYFAFGWLFFMADIEALLSSTTRSIHFRHGKGYLMLQLGSRFLCWLLPKLRGWQSRYPIRAVRRRFFHVHCWLVFGLFTGNEITIRHAIGPCSLLEVWLAEHHCIVLTNFVARGH